MARKKKSDVIVGLSKIDNLEVQKSLPLFSLWRSELTLGEFKIMDIYLSRINSHEPNKRIVIFEKGEIEKALGVKQIKPKELDERLSHLMTTVRIVDDTTKRGFTRIALFEKAHAEQDESTGLWKLELECTQSAMKYIFNIDEIGYLRYKLRCITAINSRYSYIMFNYLEHNRFRKKWQIDLDGLKHILNCENEETYKEYKRFNDLILKKAHKELNDKTECEYEYKPIKKGRSVVAIEFELKSKSKIIEAETKASDEVAEGQMNIDEFMNNDEIETIRTITRNEFNQKEMELIKALIIQYSSEYTKRIDFLNVMYKNMCTYNPDNRFSYLKKMLMNANERKENAPKHASAPLPDWYADYKKDLSEPVKKEELSAEELEKELAIEMAKLRGELHE